jgi:hypothetical protein
MWIVRQTALSSVWVLLPLLFACDGDNLVGVEDRDGGPGPCMTDEDCPDRFACNAPLRLCYALDECGPDMPCPEPEVCVEADNGYRRCRFERCEDASDCTELSCGSDLIPTCTAGSCICGEPCNGGCPPGRGCCIPTEMCLDLPPECMGLECPPGQFVSVTSSGAWSRRECEVTGETCACEVLPPLPIGDIGLYSALAADATGAVMSAYNLDYGDLMFGFVQPDGSVDWSFVDGVPTTTTSITGDVEGPRGGNSDPGLDVGLYTDIATDNVGQPHIVYQERERGALRYARRSNAGWTIHTVDGDGIGSTGLYSSIAFDMGGVPHVAYLAAREERANQRSSSLRIAWANGAEPSARGDWSFRDVDTYDLSGESCTHRCNIDEVCLASTDTCVVPDPRNACSPTCGSGEACVSGACAAIRSGPAFYDLPLARGLWPSLAVLGDGTVLIAYHDRVEQNLKIARITGDLRNAPIEIVTLDGAGAPNGSTDETGLFPSLYATPGGELHLTYLNATRQALGYLLLDANLDAVVREEVESGLGMGGGPDGALIGADSALVVDASGVARVAYQDATLGDLKYARRQGPNNWVVITLAGDEDPYRGSFGFYTDQVLDSGRLNPQVSTYRYFLSAPGGPMNGVDLFSPP